MISPYCPFRAVGPVRRLREAAKLSRVQLALRLGVACSRVENMESGSPMTATELLALAKALGPSPQMAALVADWRTGFDADAARLEEAAKIAGENPNA